MKVQAIPAAAATAVAGPDLLCFTISAAIGKSHGLRSRRDYGCTARSRVFTTSVATALPRSFPATWS